MAEFDPDEIDTLQGLSTSRSGLADELSDPQVAGELVALTHNEVGQQGPKAQQAFLETVFNRAAARGMTLARTVRDRSYYPKASYRPVRIPDTNLNDYSRMLRGVVGGSNLSNLATGNASGNVGFAGGPQTAAYGGERFGVEGPDKGWDPNRPLGTVTPTAAGTFGKFDPNELGAGEPEIRKAELYAAEYPEQTIEFNPDEKIEVPRPTPQEISTLAAPEGSPQREDINRAVAGDLTAPPGIFVPNQVGQLANAIDSALPKRPRQNIPLRPEGDQTLQEAFEQGGIVGAIASQLPAVTSDQMRPALKAAVGIVSPNLANAMETLRKTKPEIAEGIELGASNIASGFTSPSTLLQLPTFAIPGVAEAWGLGQLVQTPQHWERIKGIIDAKGIGSSEAVAAMTEELARLGMASTAATGRTVASVRTARTQARAEVPDAMQAQIRDELAAMQRPEAPPIQPEMARVEAVEPQARIQTLVEQGVPEEQAAAQVAAETAPPTQPPAEAAPTGVVPEVAPLPESAFAPVGLTADLGAIDPRAIQDRLFSLGRTLNNFRKGFVGMVKMRPQRDLIAGWYDRIDNHGSMTGEQARNESRLYSGTNELDKAALIPVIQSGGDAAELVRQANLVIKSEKAPPELKRAYKYAVDNFSRLQSVAPKIQTIYDRALDSETSHGIDVRRRENYVNQRYDYDVMEPGRPVILDSTGGSGRASNYFKKRAVFPNYAEAIAQGYIPKNFNIDALVGNRVRAGQTLINQRLWVDQMRSELDPLTGNPIAVKLERQPDGTMGAPEGYISREVFPGMRVGVSEFFDPLVRALTAESHFPRIATRAEAFVKHNMLAFDVFHASRLMQMQAALMGKVGYRKGLSLMEYPERMLDEAVRRNEITVDMADYARRNRTDFEGGVNHGLNMGRISDALYKDSVSLWPGAKATQKWIFDKLNRGIIAESYLYMLERNRGMHPEWSERELYRNTARETNIYYRNLRSQGIFKRKTWQDATRFFLLAPQWWEGGITSELMGYGQLLKAPYDVATKQRFMLGNVAKGLGTGALAYGVAAQLINMLTRGHPTWENPEPGQKWSAWIPDVLGQHKEGFFLNPLSVFAETTHDFKKYAERESDAIAITRRIIQNKFSPVSNAIRDVVFGQDYFGQPLDGIWERTKAAAYDVSGAPLAAKSIREGMPAQRTLMATAGIKLDIGATASSQMFTRAHQYRSGKGEKVEKTPPSPYRNLDHVLQNGDMEKAKKEYQALKKQNFKDKRIDDRYQRLPTRAFTGSAAKESGFVRTLSVKERATYHQARLDQQTLRQRFDQLKRMIRR